MSYRDVDGGDFWREFEEVDADYLDLQCREESDSDSGSSEIDLDLENDGLDGNFQPSFVDDSRNLETSSTNNAAQPCSDDTGTALPADVEFHLSDDEYLLQAGCKPTCGCIARFEVSNIRMIRTVNQSLAKESRDLIILGKISAIIDMSETTGKKHKHKEMQRERDRCNFAHEGQKICRETFLFLNGIGKNTFQTLKRHYRTEGAVPRSFNYQGRNKRAVTSDDSKSIADFLDHITSIHSLDLPGRVSGFRREELKILPSSFTVESIYELYKQKCQQAMLNFKCKSTFRAIWKELRPYLIITKPSTDLCWLCQKNNMAYLRSANQPLHKRAAEIDQQRIHLEHARQAREYLNECILSSRQYLTQGLKLGANTPLTGPPIAHYGFDYAQQVHYPADPQQPGPLYFKTPRKCALFGVVCDTFPAQVNYLIDEAACATKGANSVISYIHHYLETYGLGEEKALFHADNCCGQNKNNAVIQYLAWRVANGLHKEIELNFLVAGHTKFSCDYCFGLLKKKYRTNRVSSLSDIAEVVNGSARINHAQLVMDDHGNALVPIKDWSGFLHSKSKRISQIKSYHQFILSAERLGSVRVKKHANSLESEDIQLMSPESARSGQPVIIPPPGLSVERQKYLFKEIREFCDESKRDIVCPAPIQQLSQLDMFASTTAESKKTAKKSTKASSTTPIRKRKNQS
ncbi:uncharacterized protein [Watersipora subatra]|uniref:uncharacterized protein n=1 Tax=Watersipora subatra TaxID=2589382 RepID=UPI00355C5755